MTDDMHREAFERIMRNAWNGHFYPDRLPSRPDEYLRTAEHTAYTGWCAAIRHMREQNEQRDSHE